MIPLLLVGMCFGFVVLSLKDGKSPVKSIPSVTSGNEVKSQSYLEQFQNLIRQGHRPNPWLVTKAVNEAFQNGNWVLAKTISDSYTGPMQTRKRRAVQEVPKKEIQADKQVEAAPEPEQKLLDFKVDRTTSPIDGVSNDDWRMFVQASSIEAPDFESENSKGMFRQNKKRTLKLGMDVNTPVEQYSAFEGEVMQLLDEGRDIIKQSVAMPIDVDGESVPMTLSGLIAVMRVAGTSNAAKWVDSAEERKKFPNTTKVFKLTNGCF